MKTNISLEEARQLLMECAQPVEECSAALPDALDRVLSRNIHANIDLPPFPKSPVDGYALRAEDIARAQIANPVTLKVIEEVRAGYAPREKVTAQTTIKVMTGAPIPEGANAVVRFEDVKREGNLLELDQAVKAGHNIILAGEDVQKGERVAEQGAIINPPLLGLLAALGIKETAVFRKVKIAIFSTGDELTEPGAELGPGKIYESNLHSLVAACARLKAEPISFGVVPDDQAAIAARLSRALAQADLVITTGGVSAGDYDLVPDAVREVGAEGIFHKINMKPGSPMLAAKYNDKLILALSGNPAAAFVTFDLLVVPVIKKIMGLARQLPREMKAILAEDFLKASEQRRFLRAKIYSEREKNYVKLTGKQSNGILKSLVDCDAFVDVPAGSGPLAAGQEVSVVMI